MPDLHEDDLFRDSTMTFGQHLNELRGCLVKSFLGLLAGFIIGLMIGNHVVTFIQRPLSHALNNYFKKESLARIEKEITNLKETGGELPFTAEDAKHRIEEENLFLEEVYVDPANIMLKLKETYPSQFENVPLPQENEKDPAVGDGAHDKLARLFLWRPSADDSRVRIKSLNAQEAFTVYLKASLLVGILLASPWIFYQIWNFVAAGLYPHERHYVHLYLPFSLGLFLLGAGLAFFVVFEPVLNFLFSFNKNLGIDPDPRINEWLGFVLILPIGFGVGFQLPLVMLFLERIGIFTIAGYLKQWRIAVLVIFVTAAFLTPPDPYSMLLLAFPLTILYFGGILLCRLMPRRSSPFGSLTSE